MCVQASNANAPIKYVGSITHLLNLLSVITISGLDLCKGLR